MCENRNKTIMKNYREFVGLYKLATGVSMLRCGIRIRHLYQPKTVIKMHL